LRRRRGAGSGRRGGWQPPGAFRAPRRARRRTDWGGPLRGRNGLPPARAADTTALRVTRRRHGVHGGGERSGGWPASTTCCEGSASRRRTGSVRRASERGARHCPKPCPTAQFRATAGRSRDPLYRSRSLSQGQSDTGPNGVCMGSRNPRSAKYTGGMQSPQSLVLCSDVVNQSRPEWTLRLARARNEGVGSSSLPVGSPRSPCKAVVSAAG
jgi:hypothetical protein